MIFHITFNRRFRKFWFSLSLISYLTEFDVTKNGIGVGHGLRGELLTELRVLLKTEWGHCGGPIWEIIVAFPFPILVVRPFKQGILGQLLSSLSDPPETKFNSRFSSINRTTMIINQFSHSPLSTNHIFVQKRKNSIHENYL